MRLDQDIMQSGLGASRKLVLAALRALIGNAQSAVLGMDALAREAGLPVRTVSRALHELQQLGLVSREARYADGRREGLIRSWSRFRLHLAELAGALKASRAALRLRLDQAFAVAAVRAARRMAAIHAASSFAQRSAKVAAVMEQTDISYLWRGLSAVPEGSVEWQTVAAALVARGQAENVGQLLGMGAA